MTRRADCPWWCVEDVTDATEVQHRVVVGDVRLTRVHVPGGRRTTFAVRRRSGRTAAQVARLCEDLGAVSELLRREYGRRRVVFQDNAVLLNDDAPAFAEFALR